MRNPRRKSFPGHPERPDRRRFLAWNAGALLLSMIARFKFLEKRFPHHAVLPGREGRYYRKIK